MSGCRADLVFSNRKERAGQMSSFTPNMCSGRAVGAPRPEATFLTRPLTINLQAFQGPPRAPGTKGTTRHGHRYQS